MSKRKKFKGPNASKFNKVVARGNLNRAIGERRPRTTYGADDYSPDELEFLYAMQDLKGEVGPFPSWSEVLAKLKSLGYRKVGDSPHPPAEPKGDDQT